jgi:hypothetical protein
MKIAIYNPHLSPNIYNLGIHNYIIDLVNRGYVDYIFIDRIGKDYARQSLKVFLQKLNLACLFKVPPVQSAIPFDWSKIIFSERTLRSECDVLISFNTHLKSQSVSDAVKKFDGLKVWHVGDYFWNEPASNISKRFVNHGIDYLFGYAAHDKYCDFFKTKFNYYSGKVIPVPFGFTDRFININSFDLRINKVVGVGSVNPIRMLDWDVKCFKEVSDFYPDECWMHRTRRFLLKEKENIRDYADLMFPEFPQVKDFRYDLVNKFNEYTMFTSCESIYYFPPAKVFEGAACGTVNVLIDHWCNKDLGFKDGLNCIMYKEGCKESFKEKVGFYQNNIDKLSDIASNGERHVRKNFTHASIAALIYDSLNVAYTSLTNCNKN